MNERFWSPRVEHKSLGLSNQVYLFHTKDNEGAYDTPPQNMPLWHTECFELSYLRKNKHRKSLPFLTKIGHKMSHEKDAFLVLKRTEKNVLLIRKREPVLKWVCRNKPIISKITLIIHWFLSCPHKYLLVTSPQFVAPTEPKSLRSEKYHYFINK